VKWLGLRTVGQLRRSLQLPLPSKPDSRYPVGGIVRGVRKFNPVQIPSRLQKALPFSSKPKNLTPRTSNKPLYQQMMSDNFRQLLPTTDRRQIRLLQQVSTLKNVKDTKREESDHMRRASRAKRRASEMSFHADASKALRKERYVAEGQKEKRRRVEADA